eukprot:COSAG01_NODE_29566_length_634_cov_4.429907_1_plen_114_part_10
MVLARECTVPVPVQLYQYRYRYYLWYRYRYRYDCTAVRSSTTKDAIPVLSTTVAIHRSCTGLYEYLLSTDVGSYRSTTVVLLVVVSIRQTQRDEASPFGSSLVLDRCEPQIAAS